MKILPTICPSCTGQLQVQSLLCTKCQTSINGSFNLPYINKLDTKEQLFVLDFVMCSGNLKQIAQQMGLSYPTVRNMLDDIIVKLEMFRHEKTN